MKTNGERESGKVLWPPQVEKRIGSDREVRRLNKMIFIFCWWKEMKYRIIMYFFLELEEI